MWSCVTHGFPYWLKKNYCVIKNKYDSLQRKQFTFQIISGVGSKHKQNKNTGEQLKLNHIVYL